jgi:hypothetical protein
MAASLGLTLAEFSAERGSGRVPHGEEDPALRLVRDAFVVSSERSTEDLVADALDNLPWTALLVEAARDRRRWDELWKEAFEDMQLEQLAYDARAESSAESLRQAEREQRERERQEWERQARERYMRPGPGAAGSVERAAFVFRFCGVPDADRLDARGLRTAWIGLMRRHHPDGSATAVDVREINAAYDALKERLATGRAPT